MAALNRPDHPQKLTRETENIILLSRDLALASPTWNSRPTEIEFSFNNLCNLKCIMCGKADGEPVERMDLQSGVRILDQVLPCALHLTPSANSEPFLNDLDLIHELCVKHNVTLFLFTNGLLCTEEKFRRIQDRVHRIWFSFDSHVKETYEEIRAGSDYDRVVANMKRTVELAAEDHTEVTFHFVLMRNNLLELPDYVRFIARLGGRRIQVQELLPNSRQYNALALEGAYTPQEVLDVLEAARTAAREQGIDLIFVLPPPYTGDVHSLPESVSIKSPVAALREIFMESFRRIYPSVCNMSLNYLKIDPAGDCYPCCRAPSALKMGNLLEQSFDDVWNGEAFQRFRGKMFARDYEPVCRGCSVLRGNPHFVE